MRKKLNKLRYVTNTKREKIASLMREYEKVVTINAEIEKAEEILEDSAEGQRLRFLENEADVRQPTGGAGVGPQEAGR